ncbi:MAG: hypothetical protein KDB14_17140 [Planctomycetales bacterium]|nr:hypothetical protein [Planctomycetales bacterium]
MPRYVILKHRLPPTSERAGVHYDLMFELDGELLTFALPAEPIAPGCQRVEPLPNHRLAYLDYEGPISGGRGHVTRWDCGTYDGGWQGEARWHCHCQGDRGDFQATVQRRADHTWQLDLEATTSEDGGRGAGR